VTKDTYFLIVTRGHAADTEALRACIHSDAAYIGMIGSKRKVRLMRENFLANNWSDEVQFDRVHAPVGLNIESKTVQEIAVSICAEIIQERNAEKAHASGSFHGIILAAGASKRMG
jgi:xanthine dehydrogenase accessory factor